MIVSFDWIRYFIFGSVVVYFVFDYLENKRIKDEREEFINLKAADLVQKMTLYSIAVLALSYMLYQEMPAFVPLVVIVICTMYAEIFSKIYLRRKY